jgi:very-short-patch-repair endonuclease
MVLKMANKNCELCDVLMADVIHNKKVCDECKQEYKRLYTNKYYHNNKDSKKEDFSHELLKDLLFKGKPELLTPRGFSLSSEHTAQSITRSLNKSWFAILEEYNKLDELKEYVIQEVKIFYEENGKLSIADFVLVHPYISQDVFKFFGYTNIKTEAGFSRKGTINKDELIKYFLELVDTLGYVPNYSEFMRESKIKIYKYMNMFSIDKTWDSVVKNIVDKELFESYLKHVKERKVEVAKLGRSSQPKLDENMIEQEFRRVFDSCFVLYNAYPTRRLFNKLSTLSDGAYRKRYKESWNKTVTRYGYPVQKDNPSEKLLLGMISRLTNAKYTPQVRFDWLKGFKGKYLFCDGYFEELNLIVEFDGIQHRKPIKNRGGIERFKTQITNDMIKNVYLKNRGYQLLRISSEDNWDDIEFLKEILIKNNIPILTPTS